MCRALAMSGTSQIGHEDNCATLSGLAERQKRICRRNVEVMAAVKDGAHMAIEECQHQFKDRRWNCSMVDSKSLFGSLVYQGKHRECHMALTMSHIQTVSHGTVSVAG